MPPVALLLTALLAPGSTPPVRPTRPVQEDPLAAAIDVSRRAMVRHLVESSLAPGCAAAVAIRGEVVWEEGFGFADLDHRVEAGVETRFGLGSLSKALTMACAGGLVQDGLLDLDAPVEDYLPDFPFAEEGITLRLLAAHQSGLTDDVTSALADSDENFATIEDAYRRIVAGERLTSAPGEGVRYSNGPYTILARAMEVASGKSYLELMQEYVLGPAGMEETVPNDRRAIIPLRTGFYRVAEGGHFEHATHHDPSIKLAAAGWLATAGDMARFGAALLAGELVEGPVRDDLLTRVPLSDGTLTEFGMGLRYTEDEGRGVWHAPGGGHGISCWLLLYPEVELTIVILSNCSTGPVGGPVMGVLTEEFVRLAEGSSR